MRCIGNVANAEKHGAGGEIPVFAGIDVAQLERSDFLLGGIKDILDDGIEQEVNFLIVLGAVQHDFRGAELVAAMDERDFRGEAGEECSFFHGGVAAPDYGDFLAREKEAIAGGAGRDAVPDQRLFARQPEPACGGATGDDESASVESCLCRPGNGEGTLAEIG